MLQEFLNWLAHDDGFYVHVAVFALLILGGLGFPIPEDIPLALGGVAAAKGIVSLPRVFVTCYVGVLVADQILFLVGYYFGKPILNASTRSRFLPSVTEEKVEELREGLRKRRLLYIFVGRHLFPVRSATFLTAGALRIPYLEFLISDAIAAVLSVSIVVGIGYFLGERLTQQVLDSVLPNAGYYITAILLIGGLIYWARRLARNKRRQRKIAAEAMRASSDSAVATEVATSGGNAESPNT